MSAGGMESPYSIASLPTPIDATSGRVYAAPIYGVRDSKKRKRHEVVVGVDGESVNLYNAQTQRSITSYALPPQSYLCCAPVSVHVRSANSSNRRVTYCILKDGPKEKRRRLVCYAENTRKGAEESAAPVKTESNLKDGEIANLDAVPHGSDGNLAIIVTYSDGTTSVLNGDLSTKVDLANPSTGISDQYEVESAGTLTIEVARKGLLRNREDVIALLDRVGGTPTLQWRVLRTATARTFQLLALKLSQLEGMQIAGSGLTPLMSYDLLPVAGTLKIGGHHELHAPTGTLYELVGGRLSVFDLSGTIIKLVTRLGSRTSPVSSFSRLSATTVLAVGGGVATMYETQYGSIQGTMSLTASAPGTESRKRKHEEIDSQLGRFNLISWFSELGLALGLSGSELMAMQIRGISTSHKRGQGRGARLADVMGKGSVNENRGVERIEKRIEKWDQWTAKVDSLVETNDIGGLESLVANDRRLGRQRKSHELPDLDSEAGAVFDDRSAYEDLWPLPEAFDPQNLDQDKIAYVSKRMFSLGQSSDDRLEVAIRSAKLIEWLALTGCLSAAAIRKALQSSGDVSSTDGLIQPGDIMAAIRTIDEDFQLMHDLLHLPVHWDKEETIQALRTILQSFNTDPPTEAQLALPAPSITNGDVQMTNGDAESELEVAESELDHAVNALTTGLEVRSDALRAIFAHLNSLDHANVTSTMRSMMSQEELFFLIHILRIELADGGWTSRYIDVGGGIEPEGGMVDALAGIEESGPSDESIKVIGFLLNCAVDAIGVSGWLVGLGGNWSAKELVESLRAEVSAGYEGCLEASTVKSFLAEIEKYAGFSEQRQAVYPSDGMDGDGFGMAVLPIGGKAVAPTVKSRRDKSQEKGKIAQMHEKSRNVGKYVFERIRI